MDRRNRRMYLTKRFVPFLFLLLLLLLLLGIGSVLLTTNPTAPTALTLNRLPTRLDFLPFVNFFLFLLLITFGKGIIKVLRLSRFGSGGTNCSFENVILYSALLP